MKWEPVAAMVLLLGLGYWLAREPRVPGLRDGAVTQKVILGGNKGVLERRTEQNGEPTFRFLFRDGKASEVMTKPELGRMVTPAVAESLSRSSDRWLFRKLNITTWAGVTWVAFGFLGQFAFSGRMLLQWFVSEKRKESIVTIGFWWMSLIGGAILFTYFIWRQDIVGVLGQSTGVVIYARNIRLYYKKRRREIKDNERRRATEESLARAGLAPEPKPEALTTASVASR